MYAETVTADSRVIIVGAGLAGFTAAETLRQGGHHGEIVVVGAETHRPYDRPPLSKGMLSGALAISDVSLEPMGALEVDLRLGLSALALDVPARSVSLSDGSSLAADVVIIASGSRPKLLPTDLGGVHTLYSLDDALAIREQIGEGSKVVSIGTGFIGLEAASAARSLGASATVIGNSAPLHRRFGQFASEAVLGLHERNGVDFVLGATELEFRSDGRARIASVVANGTEIEADVVVVGIGSAPNVEWLAGSGLLIDDGIVTDQWGKAAPGIFAVGDCARWQRPDGTSHRGEHWTAAQSEAREVAHLLLGAPLSPKVEPDYVWSDQHGVRLQIAGLIPPDAVCEVESGSIEDADLLLRYSHPDGTDAARFGMNSARQIMRWRKQNRWDRTFPPAPDPGSEASTPSVPDEPAAAGVGGQSQEY
ncbi:NAD(P)/FAD-dependent oxidoreductase [Naumannella halotolerans]|uniref:NAD/ferredoxin-dependent reductase-like protein n=1 Tax=Naumannella halotolerans TaxID=993414 RepID=A0A4V3EMR5_9ACTN|nr:FAD-dependent oxidoreductase [Naumannella halotolerans]TDT30938.1 NAD/ferredoxin-dependent reductase-like protein [Naumannella halotolerans]